MSEHKHTKMSSQQVARIGDEQRLWTQSTESLGYADSTEKSDEKRIYLSEECFDVIGVLETAPIVVMLY